MKDKHAELILSMPTNFAILFINILGVVDPSFIMNNCQRYSWKLIIGNSKILRDFVKSKNIIIIYYDIFCNFFYYSI